MNIYAWNNNYSTKTIKLQKLVTRATELETRMRKYRNETRDGDYAMKLVYAPYNGWQ